MTAEDWLVLLGGIVAVGGVFFLALLLIGI